MNRMAILAAILPAAVAGCGQDGDGPWSSAELRVLYSLSPPPKPSPSAGNPFADDPRAAELGRKLFFDQALSADGTIACASCHDPKRYFTDGRARAKGLAMVDRNAPTVIGPGAAPFVFHDGRKDSLWAQALGPLENDAEHRFDRTAVLRRLAGQYRAEYEAIFGALPAPGELAALPAHARPRALDSRHPQQQAWAALTDAQRAAITGAFVNAGKAIEAYERKLAPAPAPFDAYVAAVKRQDPKADSLLPVAARRGLRAFLGEAGCVNCHNGPLLSDHGFHNLGLPPGEGVAGIDAGRSVGADLVRHDEFRCGSVWSAAKDCPELRFLNPQFEDFLGAFRTPSLRNVAETAPYMHAGQFATLGDVLKFYQTLPGQPTVGHRELTLRPLPSGIDAADLEAFLRTLTGPLPDAHWLSGQG